MGIVPNGMSVLTKDGLESKFVVWNRDKLIDFINSKVYEINGVQAGRSIVC